MRTDFMLFIAAGAFHVAKVTDLIPELQGRFPVQVNLTSLTREDFVRILSQPDNALTLQYAALLAVDKVRLSFEEDALEAIAQAACNMNDAGKTWAPGACTRCLRICWRISPLTRAARDAGGGPGDHRAVCQGTRQSRQESGLHKYIL